MECMQAIIQTQAATLTISRTNKRTDKILQVWRFSKQKEKMNATKADKIRGNIQARSRSSWPLRGKIKKKRSGKMKNLTSCSTWSTEQGGKFNIIYLHLHLHLLNAQCNIHVLLIEGIPFNSFFWLPILAIYILSPKWYFSYSINYFVYFIVCSHSLCWRWLEYIYQYWIAICYMNQIFWALNRFSYS